MQTKSMYRPAGISLTAVGLAFAGSALFVLGFQTLVDTPHPGALAADLARVASYARPHLGSLRAMTHTAREQLLSHPMYSAENGTDGWVQRNLPSAR